MPLQVNIQLSYYHSLKTLFPPPVEWPWQAYENQLTVDLRVYFWFLSVCLSLCQYHILLITVAL